MLMISKVFKILLAASLLCIMFVDAGLARSGKAREIEDPNKGKSRVNWNEPNKTYRERMLEQMYPIDNLSEPQLEHLSVRKSLNSLGVEAISDAIMGNNNGGGLIYIGATKTRYTASFFNDAHHFEKLIDYSTDSASKFTLVLGYAFKNVDKLSEYIKNQESWNAVVVIHKDVFNQGDNVKIAGSEFYLLLKDGDVRKIKKNKTRCELSVYEPCGNLKSKADEYGACKKEKSELNAGNILEALLASIAEASSCQFSHVGS